MMKTLAVFLLAGACLGPIYGQEEKKAASTGTADAIKQWEHDFTDAAKAGDVDKLSAMLADDWVGLGSDGAQMTKKQLLDSVKNGEVKIESMEFGPMHVKVIGSVAVVQGSDTEKSSLKGKDTSGKWVWMDVLEKRDGKWQSVRSQSAMVKK